MLGIMTKRVSIPKGPLMQPPTSQQSTKKKKLTKQEERNAKFLLAAQEGDFEKIERYVTQGKIVHVATTVLEQDGRNAYHIACEYGHIDIVQYLVLGVLPSSSSSSSRRLQQPPPTGCVDVNCVNQITGWTGLHYACRQNQLEMIQYLIETCHANVEAKDEYHHTALHYASFDGYLQIVQYLVQQWPENVHARGMEGHTPFHTACEMGRLDIVQYYVEECSGHGTPGSEWTTETVSTVATTGTTSSSCSTTTEQEHHHSYQYPPFTNSIVTIDNGMTPLHFSCQKGHLSVVKYLIHHCCPNGYSDINAVTTIGGNTPYDLARTAQHHDVMEFINHRCEHLDLYFTSIENGNVTSFIKFVVVGNTTNISKRNLRPSSVNSSLSNGSSGSSSKNIPTTGSTINVHTTKNENGNMALHVAASCYTTNHSNNSYHRHNTNTNVSNNNNSNTNNNGYIEIMKYIVHTLHISCDLCNEDGWTALHFASAIGHLPVVVYLVEECYANIYRPTGDTGDTPLHLASRNGHLNIVQYLVHDCCCRTIKNVNHTQNNNRKMIVQTNMAGETPHDQTIQANHVSIIEYYELRQEVEDQYFQSVQDGNLYRMKEFLRGSSRSTGGSGEPTTATDHSNNVDTNNNRYGIHVETRNPNDSTVLHFACRYGHLHIVQYLTEQYHDTININAWNKDGCTPLHFASGSGHLDIVQYLIEECCCTMTVNINDMTNDGNTAYDLALNYQKYNVTDYLSNIDNHKKIKNDRINNVTATIRTSQRQRTNSFQSPATDNAVAANAEQTEQILLDPEVIADRNKLELVVHDPTADPIVLSSKYLDYCTNQFTSKLLGEGAFGKVYLGYDHDFVPAQNNINNNIVGIQLAVKRIRFDVLDVKKIDQIILSFRREIAVLKRFRHPNIVILYGYNVQLQQSCQFLVYEYLSNGSLDTFLMDERGRTRLPSQVRLSIMFQIARSVHFLHTGGCDELVIFHRDIKAGNICLAKDYTAKLIDCGLAKFVPDNKNASTPGSIAPTIFNESGAVAFGTPGYVCPIYSRGHVSFSAACDVFSLGVVFAELIVGCLQGGHSSRGEQNFGDYYSRYIRDDDDEIIENGWQILMREADLAAEWKSSVLELLCKVTMRCMAASPKRRYSTSDLVEELSSISSMEFTGSSTPDNEIDNAQVQELYMNEMIVPENTLYVNCVLCHRLTRKVITCTDGHPTCVQCIEQKIQMEIGRSGTSVGCKCGIAFCDDALYGTITAATFQLYVRERGIQKSLDQNFSDIKKRLNTIVSMTESNHDEVMTRLKSIDSKIQRVLGGLAYIATNSVQECPTLIWLVPAERAAGNSAKSWKQWTKDLGQRRYDLYFVCQHSFEVVDMKLGITVSRSWLVQAAPVLYLSLFFLRLALTIGGLPPLPFPVQKIGRATQIAMNEDYIGDMLDEACIRSMEAFKAAYTNGTDLPYTESAQLLTSMSASYEGIVTKATSMKKCVWKQSMEPVANHFGSIIWIKKEYRGLYI